MLRTIVFTAFLTGLVLSGIGCGSGTSGPRNDLPVTGGDEKKGKTAGRAIEAGIPDPNAKK